MSQSAPHTPPQALRFSHGRGERETSDWWWTPRDHGKGTSGYKAVLWRVIPGNLGIIFTGDTQYPLSESGAHHDLVTNLKVSGCAVHSSPGRDQSDRYDPSSRRSETFVTST